MQNTLVIVDSNFTRKLLFSYQLNIYSDITFIKSIKSPDLLETWLEVNDSDPELTPHAVAQFEHFKTFCAPYNRIILALTPGPGAEQAAGLIAMVLQDTPVKVFTTGEQPLQRELFKNTRTLIKAGPHMVYAAYVRQKYKEVFARQYPYKSPDGVEKIEYVKQAFMLHLTSMRETEIECQQQDEMNHVCVLIKMQGKKKAFPVIQVGKEEIHNVNIHYARALIARLKESTFSIKSVTEKTVKSSPPPPYTTQTLYADVERLYQYSAKKTLNILKKMYRGIELGNKGIVPLISYYMSNSEHVDKTQIQDLREHIYSNYGADYLPKRAVSHKSVNPSGSAIYPLSLKHEPKKLKKHLSQSQYKIYALIWQRYVASQMIKSIATETTVTIHNDQEDPCECQAVFTNISFRGYRQVYDDLTCVVEQESIPEKWRPGTEVKIDSYDIKIIPLDAIRHFTISELLAHWLKAGAGTVQEFFIESGMLFAKTLLNVDKHKIYPSNAGYESINSLLIQFPSLVNPGLIMRQDNLVHTVALGKQTVTGVLFEIEKNNPDAISAETGVCPLCGGKLIIGAGNMLKCEHHPESCVYIIEQQGNHICEECGSKLVQREGKYGKFWACSRFPKCRFTRTFTLNIKCPSMGCDGNIVERKSAKGQLFYGCSNYPVCKFSSSKKPINMICSQCGHHYLLKYTINEEHDAYQCPQCSHLFNEQFVAIS